MPTYSQGYQKPHPGATIDWMHPLARGLVACYCARPGNILMRDLARGRTNDLSNNGGVSLVNTVSPGQFANSGIPSIMPTGNSMNPSALFVGSSTQYLSAADTPDLQTGNIDWTIYFWIKPTTLNGSGQMILTKLGSANANREFQIYATDANLKCDWWVNNANSSADVTKTGLLVAGYWIVAFVWHSLADNTINMQAFNPQLGMNVSTVASTAASGGNVGSASFQIGGRELTGNPTFDGFIDNVQIRKRVLTQDERTQLARQPYAFFQQSTFRRYFYAPPPPPAPGSGRSFPLIMG